LVGSTSETLSNHNKLIGKGGMIPMGDVKRQIFIPTSFNSENKTQASEVWEDIEAGHGEVSIDSNWAAARGLPPSMIHPLDKKKMVYTTASYHAIHCLVSLLASKQPPII
jgi:hypothetical protein